MLFGRRDNKRQDSNAQDGFVLAEILVAMIVLAIAAILFLQVVQGTAKRMRKVKTDSALTRLAISKITQAVNQSVYDNELGAGKDEDTEINWRVIVEPDPKRRAQNAEQPSILNITVDVWQDGQPHLQLTSAKWAGGS